MELKTPIEIRDIFKLAHHDIANTVIEQFIQKNKDFKLKNSDPNEMIDLFSEQLSQIYKEQLAKEMKHNALEIVKRIANANS